MKKNLLTFIRRRNSSYNCHQSRQRLTNVITMTTSLAKNSPITFYIDATSSVTIDGATGTFVNAQFVTYNTTKDTITITGDVTKIWCIKDSLTALDVTNDTVLELLGLLLQQVAGA
jgi:hypothetical protein